MITQAVCSAIAIKFCEVVVPENSSTALTRLKSDIVPEYRMRRRKEKSCRRNCVSVRLRQMGQVPSVSAPVRNTDNQAGSIAGLHGRYGNFRG